VQPEIYRISFKDISVMDVDKTIKTGRDQFSFFNSDDGIPYISEAWKRSKSFHNTGIRERSLYFICLLTGSIKIQDAIKKGGYNSVQKSALLITEMGLSLLWHTDVSSEIQHYKKVDEKPKESYFKMTLVETELIKQ
jgi:hypothetical protein